jgi:hypothetical protein
MEPSRGRATRAHRRRRAFAPLRDQGVVIFGSGLCLSGEYESTTLMFVAPFIVNGRALANGLRLNPFENRHSRL